MPTIAVLCATILACFAVSLGLPLFAALAEGNWRALEAFSVLMVGYGFVAGALIIGLRPRMRTLNRAGVFGGAIAVWVTFVLAAAPPFALIEAQSPVRAFFEAVSAAVTLGVSLRPIADISNAMAFYRGTTAWIGGLLTLLMAVYVLGLYRVGGTPNRHLRMIQHAHQARGPRIFKTTQAIVVPYFAFTVACALLLTVFGVPGAPAMISAMSMLSTNGFIPYLGSSSVLDNVWAEIVMLVFMVVGATSILWHRMILDRRWAMAGEQSEGNRYLVAILVVVALVAFASLFMPHMLQSPPQRAFNFAFDIVSVMTTTGVTHDPRLGLGLPFELVLLIGLIGGCAYSTAGGIRFFRLSAMLHHLNNELRRLVHPNAALRDSVDYDEDERERAKAIWSAFFIAILALTLAVLAFAFQGIALPSALGLATGAFSQIGNIVAASIPGFPQSGVSDPVLLTTALLALVSRIEILVVLAAVSFNRW